MCIVFITTNHYINPMSKVPAYSRPPVREALIDVRINPLSADKLGVLESLHDKLAIKYPGKRPQQKWEGMWELKENTLLSAQKTHGVVGFSLESEDKKRIIQYRLDGFTCNYLKPDHRESWPGWTDLRGEAKLAWDLYATTLGVTETKRLAVRYVNQIVIPASVVELNDYLTAPPNAPKECKYQDFHDFLSRVTLDIPELKSKAIITQAPAQEKPQGAVVVLLDIDVICSESIAYDSESMWHMLDRFREIKNDIFEASLHQKAKDLFGPIQ